MSSPEEHRKTLEYATPTMRQRHELAQIVAWPVAILGTLIGGAFVAAALTLVIDSSSIQTNSVDRDYFRLNALKLGGCAVVTLTPSIWFPAVGRKRHAVIENA